MALQELRNLAAGYFLHSSVNHSSLARREEGSEGRERYRENQRRKARERARERWSLHSPAGDRPRTFCTGVFVGEIQNTFSIPPELDLPVCLSVHSLSVGFPVCLPSHLSVTGWADVCQLICLSLYEVFKLSRVHAVEEASEVKAEERKSVRMCSLICSRETSVQHHAGSPKARI